MPFNPNIPQATDRLAKSQQDLLQNNQQLNTSFGINHYAFSDLTANNGMHKQCQLVELSNPAPVSGTDSVYCAVAGSPSLGELFYVRGGGGTPIQMTSGNILNNGATEIGYTFLPGGLLLQWGKIAPASTTVNFPTAFSAAPYNIQLSAVASQGSGARIILSLFSKTSTNFVYQITQAGTVTTALVLWMAIGPGQGV
jgi:hypothetical protein